jgi:hypothetical protein
MKFPTLRCLAFQISAAVRYLIFVRPLVVSRQSMACVQRSKGQPDLRELLRRARRLALARLCPRPSAVTRAIPIAKGRPRHTGQDEDEKLALADLDKPFAG